MKSARLWMSVFGGLMAAATQASAQSLPNPNQVSISSIKYAGSGCPAGSVADTLSQDATAITLLFDEFVAETGPGLPLSLGRKNCQLLVDLRYPQGWTFALASVDHRGYANIERGAVGSQVATYYFQGEQVSRPLQTNFVGPAEGDYMVRDVLALESLVWAPCGRNIPLNINSQVRVRQTSSRHAQALLTIDSLDLKVKQIFGLKWKRCGAPLPHPIHDDEDDHGIDRDTIIRDGVGSRPGLIIR